MNPCFISVCGEDWWCTHKQTPSQTDNYLVGLSLNTYAFEDKLTKY